MADLATLQTWLAEAIAARHKLVTGTGVAMVRYEGKGEVSYTKADLYMLDSYIASLQSQIAALTGLQTQRTRPIYLTF